MLLVTLLSSQCWHQQGIILLALMWVIKWTWTEPLLPCTRLRNYNEIIVADSNLEAVMNMGWLGLCRFVGASACALHQPDKI